MWGFLFVFLFWGAGSLFVCLGLFCLVLEIESHCLAQSDLNLMVHLPLPPSVGITGVCQRTQPNVCFG